MDEKGNWKLAPAYDLTFSSSSHGMHSTTVNGEGKSPEEKDLLALAAHFDVPHAKEILDQVRGTISTWKNYAHTAGVSRVSEILIEKTLNP